ncbi:MAG: disulfide bond formation protein B [Parcubacteria group bacterium]|nr:disulfide bond formation protein B [Parcubacteria group bacterium]
MSPFVSNLNFLLAFATLLSQVFLIALTLAYFFRKKYPVLDSFFRAAAQYALPVAFLFALGATILSLIYSEVFGFVPCGLCWLQRVFLYPQAVLLGLAWWKKDSRIADYIIALSLLGVIVALDQHFLQMGISSGLPCLASGNTDCAKRILFEFNYITFPLMSFTAFLWQIGLMTLLRKSAKTEKKR